MFFCHSYFRAVWSDNFNIIKEIPVVDCFLEGFGERSFLKQGYRDSEVQFQQNYFSILLISDAIFICSIGEFATSFSRSRKLAVWFVSVSSACIVSKQGKLRSNVRLTENWTQLCQHSATW